MTAQPIRLFGDPVLRTPTSFVTSFDRELRVLVGDLTETMHEAPGAGLSANQIGVSLRVFTFDVEGESGHVVNPELWTSDDTQEGDEGCLSVPGVVANTTRAATARVRGMNMWGDPIMIECVGMLARCIQHEVDHLDGVLFLSRLDRESQKQAMRDVRDSGWFGADPPVVKVTPHEFGRWF